MIEEGLELMLAGMGVVFAFLILLVGFMYFSGAFFSRFFQEQAEPTSARPPDREPAESPERRAVAIAAAYRAHRDS